MKLSFVCLVVLLAALCIASEASKKRDKRFIVSLSKIVDTVKTATAKVVGNSVSLVKTTAGKVKNVTKYIVKKVDNVIDKSVYRVKDAAGDVTKKIINKVDNAIDNTFDRVKYAGKLTGKIANVAIDKTGDFIDNSVESIKKAVKITVKTVKFSKKIYKATYVAAKKSWKAIKNLADKVPFDKALLVVVDLVDSGISNYACKISCEAEAVSVFGPAAMSYADFGCPILCEAALAVIEDVLENRVESLMED